MSSPAVIEVAKWLVFPRFREEGPPSYLRVLLTEESLLRDSSLKGVTNQVGHLILLGYRPATVIGIINTFLDNGNQPLYGAELGKSLEKRYGLEEGQYTKGRYYDDRIAKVVAPLIRFGILKEEVVNVSGTQKTTPGYRLTGGFYQVLGSKTDRGEFPLVGVWASDSKTVRVCSNDRFVTADWAAKYCQLCGWPLSSACSSCRKIVIPGNQFCTACGQKLS